MANLKSSQTKTLTRKWPEQGTEKQPKETHEIKESKRESRDGPKPMTALMGIDRYAAYQLESAEVRGAEGV